MSPSNVRPFLVSRGQGAAAGTWALLALIAGWWLAGCQDRIARLDLPQVEVDSFEPAIRKQIEAARAAAEEHPNDPTAVGAYGMVLQAYEEFASAARAYGLARQLEPDNFAWVYYQGRAVVRTARHEEALGFLLEAARLRPDYAPLQVALGDLYMEVSNTEKALACYRAAVEIDAGSALAHYGLGQASRSAGELRVAVEQYRAAIMLSPEFGAAHYALGLAYRELGAARDARRHLELSQRYRDVRPRPRDPLWADVVKLVESARARTSQARQKIDSGETEAAVRELLAAVELDPGLLESHILLIQLYGELARFEDAERHYRTALAISPNAQTARYNYCRVLIAQGRLPKASEVARELVAINPYSANGHLMLGSILDDQGRDREALEHYGLALEHAPDLPAANLFVALHLLDRGESAEVKKHIERALQVEDADRPLFLYRIGDRYRALGDPERAVEYLEEAQELALAVGRQPLADVVSQTLARWRQEAEVR